MRETIFNLYYIIERDIIRGRAAVCYKLKALEVSGEEDA